MNRRTFTKTLAVTAAAIGLRSVPALGCVTLRHFSITMDDFYWQTPVKLTAQERNQSILDTFSKHKFKAAAFVIGRNVEHQDGKDIVAAWDQAGHIIGNHTYSHRDFNAPEADVKTYSEDVLRAEALLKDYPRFRKYLRFPMLKEGDTPEKRDGMRAFMAENGYRNGHVTVDNSDWAIDQRLTARLKKDPNADLKPYRDFYLEHMWARAQYYDALAQRVTGRPVKHTILVHFNLLNGLFLNDVIKMLKGKGWIPIDAEEAYASDSIFTARPNVLPAGESIIWSLAKEKGTIAKTLRYPAEDSQYENKRMNKLRL
jgi:peptidoglycan/xylan/chitin deacetylase (PgdA/CDA1 family)